jgi:hypothetical protein
VMSIHPLLSVQQARSSISMNVFGLGLNSTNHTNLAKWKHEPS